MPGFYDASQVDIVITHATLGTTRLAGFDDGELVSVVRDEDEFIEKEGSDGFVSVAASNRKMGTVTITLQETSDSNNFLYALRAINLVKPGLGFFSIVVKCNTTGEIFTGAEAWIIKAPDSPKDREVSPRAWAIRGQLEMDRLPV